MAGLCEIIERRRAFVGTKIGRWTVIEFLGTRGRHHIDYWMCRCECGKTKEVMGSSLRRAASQSCGCLQRESAKLIGARSLKHGAAVNRQWSSEYRCWIDMRRRCDTPSQTSYKKYGARGIKVCPKWNASFEAFFNDMGPKPSPKHSIDRINPNGDYEPQNCRWATIHEQAMNRRNTIMVEYCGQSVSLWELCGGDKARAATAQRRLARGVPIERAIRPERVRRSEFVE